MTDVLPIVAWPPYVLMEHPPGLDFGFTSARSGPLPVVARPVFDAQGRDDGLYVWPILPVLGKMLDTAMTFVLIEKGLLPVPDQASQDEITKWVKATRTLAARWPFGKAKADALRALADNIESTFAIQRFFLKAKWPRTAKHRQMIQTAMTFWAVKTMHDALVTLQVKHVPTFADLAAGVVWSAVPTDKHTVLEKAIADGSLDRRVRDFRARLRPGVDDSDLMAWNLHDTLMHGADCGRVHLPETSLPTTQETQKLH